MPKFEFARRARDRRVGRRSRRCRACLRSRACQNPAEWIRSACQSAGGLVRPTTLTRCHTIRRRTPTGPGQASVPAPRSLVTSIVEKMSPRCAAWCVAMPARALRGTRLIRPARLHAAPWGKNFVGSPGPSRRPCSFPGRQFRLPASRRGGKTLGLLERRRRPEHRRCLRRSSLNRALRHERLPLGQRRAARRAARRSRRPVSRSPLGGHVEKSRAASGTAQGCRTTRQVGARSFQLTAAGDLARQEG